MAIVIVIAVRNWLSFLSAGHDKMVLFEIVQIISLDQNTFHVRICSFRPHETPFLYSHLTFILCIFNQLP